MAGINQGTPETAVGEPIRLGSNNEFEIEQHPVSDRLIIRDTQNGKVAYVRKERGGEIGGDGVLIKALKESKPMADDGRTYDTIQEAERQASSWVFVPPGTFNESVTINTDGLTLRGSGYNTEIVVNNGSVVDFSSSENVSISDLSVDVTNPSNDVGAISGGPNGLIYNVTVKNGEEGFAPGDGSTIANCRVETCEGHGIFPANELIISNCIITSPSVGNTRSGIRADDDCIITNSIIVDSGTDGIQIGGSNTIVIGCRVINSGADGIRFDISTECICANNRISDSTGSDIQNDGTGTLLDANLTGASN